MHIKDTKKKPAKGRKKKGKNGEVTVVVEQPDGSQESDEENAGESKDEEEPNKIERNKASNNKSTDKTENKGNESNTNEEESSIWKRFDIPHSLRDEDLIPDLEKIFQNNWTSFRSKTLGVSQRNF